MLDSSLLSLLRLGSCSVGLCSCVLLELGLSLHGHFYSHLSLLFTFLFSSPLVAAFLPLSLLDLSFLLESVPLVVHAVLFLALLILVFLISSHLHLSLVFLELHGGLSLCGQGWVHHLLARRALS